MDRTLGRVSHRRSHVLVETIEARTCLPSSPHMYLTTLLVNRNGSIYHDQVPVKRFRERGYNQKWESIHAAVNSSEAVENLIRVNSWNSWPIKSPRIPRILRKRSLSCGCHWFEMFRSQPDASRRGIPSR